MNVIAPFTISPSTIPANHAGHITLTLAGTGTSWNSGTTTFTISGVTGATKVSQSISSTTAATLTITTGSGTGTLTISDGTHAEPATVVVPTLTLSPATGNYEVPVSITATGSAGSIWTQETASTLFSTPGSYGDSISSISVSSDTSATFTLNPGTASTSLVVTEGPTGVTSNYTIIAPGSLRFIGPLTLSTASNSLLYNQAKASYSYFVRYNQPFGSSDLGALLANATNFLYSRNNYGVYYYAWDHNGSYTLADRGDVPGRVCVPRRRELERLGDAASPVRQRDRGRHRQRVGQHGPVRTGTRTGLDRDRSCRLPDFQPRDVEWLRPHRSRRLELAGR